MSNLIKTPQQHATAIANAEQLLSEALRDAAEAGLIIECQVNRLTYASGGERPVISLGVQQRIPPALEPS